MDGFWNLYCACGSLSYAIRRLGNNRWSTLIWPVVTRFGAERGHNALSGSLYMQKPPPPPKKKKQHSSVCKQVTIPWPCTVKWENSSTEDQISSATLLTINSNPAGTVGTTAARKTEGQQTAHAHKTLTNSDAGDSPGLWQNVKWLGRVGSGWTATRPCHGRLLCFSLWWISFQKDTDADKKVSGSNGDGVRVI